MEETVTLVCPNCQESRTFSVVRPAMVEPLTGNSGTEEHRAACRKCGLGVLLTVVPDDDTGTVIDMRPQEPPITRSQTADLPQGMADDLLEACRCYSFMAYRGAALLVRRTVEQAVVMRRAPRTKRTLQQKLDWLLDEGHLPKRWKPAADTVRDVANAAAHGASAISGEEARAAVRAGFAVVSALMAEDSRRYRTD